MADFAAPTGPPPPKVPEGWKAIWNDQYKEWFYVNLHTKQSQWDRPTEPVYAPPADGAPSDAPPGYDISTKPNLGPEKGGNLSSNNPYGPGASGSAFTDDEAYARRLQEEENARQQQNGSRGANDGYYQGPPQGTAGQPYGMQQGASPAPLEQERSKKGGLLGKIQSKLSGGSSRPPGQQYGGGYPQQGYGYPPQAYGGYPPQPAYGYPPHPGYGYPPGGGMYGRPPRRGGGLGAGGGMALGAGAGLLGGALIANSMAGNEQEAYQDGFQDGADGDFGGGDDMGDMGGDF